MAEASLSRPVPSIGTPLPLIGKSDTKPTWCPGCGDYGVVATGGDGDGFGIGAGHFVHTMRRNVDLTYVAMDNQIYGLTTGQASPTSMKGMKTKSTPYGSVENP